MAANPVSPAEMAKTLAAYEAAGGNAEAAARAMGIPSNTLKSRLRAAERQAANPFPENAVTVDELPPSDLPFAERLATMKARNALRIAHDRAKAWQNVRVPIAGPYGICWFGDPHLDDPYCDLEAFERDARTCATTEGMYGVNGGDSINNWVGKLERLYADQSATASEGWELVEWALKDLGVNWLAWILGNHDTWNYGKRIFEGMNTNRILMRDWDAKLNIVSPCGGIMRAWARHNFKGSSIYNELHGLKRAAMMDEQADVYAAFHIHTFATGSVELPGGRTACMIRARGYKDSDDYALKGQFTEQRKGRSVVTIHTPRHGMQPLTQAFDDVQEGAEFLAFKRRKVAA